MTAEFESIAELLLVVLTITCILQLVFVGLLFWYVKRMMESLGRARTAVLPPPVPPVAAARVPEAPAAGLAGQAWAPEVPVIRATTVSKAAPTVDLVSGSPDIRGSIHRLCGKYDLTDFIIATMDGLLVVSLQPGSTEVAAHYSDLYRRKKQPDSPGVTFLEIDHRGEAMIGVARSNRPLTSDQIRGIGEDAQKILDWWL